MSELKAYGIRGIDGLVVESESGQLYLKSEADKVIAELEDKVLQYKVLDKEHCRDLNTQEQFFAKQIARHKHKRCLAIAWWCSAELGMLVSTWESKIKHYKKWQKRWLELAEKFRGGV